MTDLPHLLKNMRNTYMKSSYKYEDVEIKWEYTADFYNIDRVISISGSQVDRQLYHTTPLYCSDS